MTDDFNCLHNDEGDQLDIVVPYHLVLYTSGVISCKQMSCNSLTRFSKWKHACRLNVLLLPCAWKTEMLKRPSSFLISQNLLKHFKKEMNNKHFYECRKFLRRSQDKLQKMQLLRWEWNQRTYIYIYIYIYMHGLYYSPNAGQHVLVLRILHSITC